MSKNTKELDIDNIKLVYRKLLPFYDLSFGLVSAGGRKKATRIINKLDGKKVLEIGVGTGLSLRFYNPDKKIHALDISEDMLAKAKLRVKNHNLKNIKKLFLGDGENLKLKDDSFDIVVAMHVASVTPNPQKLALEMSRICAKNGYIIIVNHFQSQNKLLLWIEKKLARFAANIGWHSDFDWSFIENTPLQIEHSKKAGPLGIFTVLCCRNNKSNAETQDKS